MFHSKLEYAVIITLISKFYLLNSEKTSQSTDVVDHGSGSSSKFFRSRGVAFILNYLVMKVFFRS